MMSKQISSLLGLAAFSLMGSTLPVRASERLVPTLGELTIHSEMVVPTAARLELPLPSNSPLQTFAPTATNVRPGVPQNAPGRAIDQKLFNAAATFPASSPRQETNGNFLDTLLGETPLPSEQAKPSQLAQRNAPSTYQQEIAWTLPGQNSPDSLGTTFQAILPAASPTQTPSPTEIAQPPLRQRNRDERRRNTASTYSYIGIGGNIGLSDDSRDNSPESPLGRGSFVINGKIGLTPNLSIRPAAVINSDADILVPITYDFRIPGRDPFEVSPFVPYAGAGVMVSTQRDNNVGFLLSGGVDYRISPEWTANGSLNLGFLEQQTNIGLILTIGYTFPGFRF